MGGVSSAIHDTPESETQSNDLSMELVDIDLPPPPPPELESASASNDSSMASSSHDNPRFEFVEVPGNFEQTRSSPTGIILLFTIFLLFGEFVVVN